MKTCNGCEHLIKLFSKSIDKKYLYVCVGEAKYGIAKAILETDKEGKIRVPTPYWCPKEEKMCNSSAINVQKEALNVN